MKIRITVLLNLAVSFAAAADVSGDWIAQVTRFGESQYARITLIHDGAKITGTWEKSEINGSVAGSSVKFSFRGNGPSGTFDARSTGPSLSAKVRWSSAAAPGLRKQSR